jgi:hypothetical protein
MIVFPIIYPLLERLNIIINSKSNFEQQYSFLELHVLKKTYVKINKNKRGKSIKYKHKT